jgi:hypothetical protein
MGSTELAIVVGEIDDFGSGDLLARDDGRYSTGLVALVRALFAATAPVVARGVGWVTSPGNDSVERLLNGLGTALPASRVVAQCFDEQVSPTQILVLPVVLLPGRGGGSGRPGPDDVSLFRNRRVRKRHLLFFSN